MIKSKRSVAFGRVLVLSMIGLMPITMTMTALADGSPAGENRSTVLRRKIELPSLRMRKGELNTERQHVEGSVGKYQDLGNDQNSGTRLEGKGQLEGIVLGYDHKTDNLGLSVGGEGKLVYERGENGARELRDAEFTGLTLFGMQSVGLRDPKFTELSAEQKQLDALTPERDEKVRQASLFSEYQRDYASRDDYSANYLHDDLKYLMKDEFSARKSAIDVKELPELDKRATEQKAKLLALQAKGSEAFNNAVFAYAKSPKLVEEGRKAVAAAAPKLERLNSLYVAKRAELKQAREDSQKARLLQEELESIWSRISSVSRDVSSAGGRLCEKEYSQLQTLSVPCKKDGKFDVAISYETARKSFKPMEEWLKKDYAEAAAYSSQLETLQKEESELAARRKALEEESGSMTKKHIENRLARFDADKAKADAEIEKVAQKIRAIEMRMSAQVEKDYKQPHREWSAIDFRVGTVGYQNKRRRELDFQQKGLVVDPASLAFHVAGEVNESIDVGLCGALSPSRAVFGKEEISGQKVGEKSYSFDARASVCAEVGLGDHLMLRNTSEVATDYVKMVELRNTTELEGLKGHGKVGVTYERASDVDSDRTVQRVLGTATAAW